KSPYLLNQFVELCLKLGKNCSIAYKPEGTAVIGVQEQHTKNELYSTRTFGKEKPQVFKENYSGMVYCPQLPENHTIIIERNGRISLSGNSYDIGFGALSGAMERNEDFIYICYDNEAYMNTGVQRSGATPFHASTTTSPKEISGKTEWKKNLAFIAATHGIPYAANASIGFFPDLKKKLDYAKTVRGFRLVVVNAPCQLGWGFDKSKTLEVARLAVRTGMWNLFEIKDGVFAFNQKPELQPVEDYLKIQGRFKHVTPAQASKIQEHLRRTRAALEKLEASGVNLKDIL
ncbi:MAG: thiamine pyrophosphate-dependent enzyme, partial [Candidatus Micrarchaeota archaeon]